MSAKKIESQKNAEIADLKENNDILRKQVNKMEKMQNDTEEMKRRLHGYSRDKQLVNEKDMKKKLDRVGRLVEDKEVIIKEQERNIKHLVYVAETTTDANLQLEKEYKRVFAAAKKRQKEMQDQEERARRDIDEAEMAKQNPFYIDTYKKKLMA